MRCWRAIKSLKILTYVGENRGNPPKISAVLGTSLCSIQSLLCTGLSFYINHNLMVTLRNLNEPNWCIKLNCIFKQNHRINKNTSYLFDTKGRTAPTAVNLRRRHGRGGATLRSLGPSARAKFGFDSQTLWTLYSGLKGWEAKGAQTLGLHLNKSVDCPTLEHALWHNNARMDGSACHILFRADDVVGDLL